MCARSFSVELGRINLCGCSHSVHNVFTNFLSVVIIASFLLSSSSSEASKIPAVLPGRRGRGHQQQHQGRRIRRFPARGGVVLGRHIQVTCTCISLAVFWDLTISFMNVWMVWIRAENWVFCTLECPEKFCKGSLLLNQKSHWTIRHALKSHRRWVAAAGKVSHSWKDEFTEWKCQQQLNSEVLTIAWMWKELHQLTCNEISEWTCVSSL